MNAVLRAIHRCDEIPVAVVDGFQAVEDVTAGAGPAVTITVCGRHREAAEHYQVALRTAPQNGVWWMGLGIALQAEKRSLEAAGAFQKALDSGTLSGELQGFVERKLKQLAR